MTLHIQIDLNVNTPGITPILHFLKGKIMSLADDLKASQASVVEHVTALESSNEALILANSTIVDALRALQTQASNGSVGADDVAAIIQANADLIAGVDTEKSKVDAATQIVP